MKQLANYGVEAQSVNSFYRATLCVSAVFAVVRCPPSVCLSVTFVHSI